MARTRNLKPGFFKNYLLGEFPFETRLLFSGLWTIADRAGRLRDFPKQIKGELFPYDNLDIDGMLNDLANCEEPFILRYEVNGKRYIQILNFAKHQNPHNKEPDSEIPEPPQTSTVQASDKPQTSTVQAPDKPQTSTVQAPDKPQTSTVQAPDKPSSSRANHLVPSTLTLPPSTNHLPPTTSNGIPSVGGGGDENPALDYYFEKISPMPQTSSSVIGEIQDTVAYFNENGNEMVMLAIDAAIEQNKRTWAYVRGIINRWKSNNIRAPAQVYAERDEFNTRHRGQSPPNKQADTLAAARAIIAEKEAQEYETI